MPQGRSRFSANTSGFADTPPESARNTSTRPAPLSARKMSPFGTRRGVRGWWNPVANRSGCSSAFQRVRCATYARTCRTASHASSPSSSVPAQRGSPSVRLRERSGTCMRTHGARVWRTLSFPSISCAGVLPSCRSSYCWCSWSCCAQPQTQAALVTRMVDFWNTGAPQS